MLVIAGDIAGSTTEIVSFMEKARDLPFNHKIFVPGNHDIWVNQQAEDLSSVKYYDILGEICNQFDIYYLPNNPLIIDDIAILGTMGWYDYSSRNRIWDDKYGINTYEQKIHPNGKVELMDRYFVRFGMNDYQIAEKMLDDLENDFNFVEHKMDQDQLKQMVVVTHMVPFSEFIPYRGVFKYDYFTAFFGNIHLGELIKEKSKDITIHSIFGQCHTPKIRHLNKNLAGYCVPIGYPREYGKNQDLKKLFQNRIIEINV